MAAPQPLPPTPTLLAAADYPLLAPVLAECHGQNLDLGAEAGKDWTRVWAVCSPETRAVLSFVLTWWTPGHVEIVDLATLPSARRRGLARTLLQHVVSTARATPDTNLSLEVRRSNLAALQLYTQLGFTLSRERRAYYEDGEDALELLLELGKP